MPIVVIMAIITSAHVLRPEMSTELLRPEKLLSRQTNSPVQKDPGQGQTLTGHPKFNGQRHYTEKDIKILEEHVRSCSISNVSKLEIMEQAVAPCPEVNLKAKGTEFKSLLDFGSMVSFMNESFFRSQLASSITPMAGDKVNAHQLFNLKGVEDGQVPLSKYFEMDVKIHGFKIPHKWDSLSKRTMHHCWIQRVNLLGSQQ